MCVCPGECVCVCHSSFSLSSWVQGTCFKSTSRQSRCCPEVYPTSHSLRAPHCWRVSQSALLASQQSPVRVSSPRVPEKKKRQLWKSCCEVFFLVSLFFLRIFFPSLVVREDPILLSSADAYWCTYQEDVGKRLPLCEGWMDFICQVPNFICYQLLIIWASLSIVGW